MMPVRKVDYDPQYDILHVGFGDRCESYGDDISDHVTIFHSVDDERITGVDIFDFTKLLKEGSPELQHIPVDIEYTNC